MWNVIKWILLIIGGFYALKFMFALISLGFSFIFGLGFIGFVILAAAVFLIYKFWDDIVFEIEWLMERNKKDNSSKNYATYNSPSTNNAQINSKIESDKRKELNRTFTFIDGKYDDYVYKKQSKMIEWVNMLERSNLTSEDKGLAGYLGPNWYPSAYGCKCCQDQLFKTVFPVNEEFLIQLDGVGEWEIKRAFTCLTCEIIYAPKPGYRYEEAVAMYKAPNESIYREKTIMMGVYGTTVGRPDI